MSFWINLIAVIALIFQNQLGFVISPESQLSILAVVNVVLRFITKDPVVWSNKKIGQKLGGS